MLDNGAKIVYYSQASKRTSKYDPLAQSVEHLTFNQGVRSSNLRWITKQTLGEHSRLSLGCFSVLYVKNEPVTDNCNRLEILLTFICT